MKLPVVSGRRPRKPCAASVISRRAGRKHVILRHSEPPTASLRAQSQGTRKGDPPDVDPRRRPDGSGISSTPLDPHSAEEHGRRGQTPFSRSNGVLFYQICAAPEYRKNSGQTGIGRIRGQTAIFRRLREKRCLAPLPARKTVSGPLLRENGVWPRILCPPVCPDDTDS